MSNFAYHGPVVAFDLDDTIFSEREFCRSGFRFLCDPDKYHVFLSTSYPSKESLKDLELKMDMELTARRNPFVPFEDFFKPLVEKTDQKWDLLNHIESYRQHKMNPVPMREGVENVLEELSSRGIRMALITDGRSVTQRRKIEALNLERYIEPELILISEETGVKKLDSNEMFATVVRHYPEAKQFFYVGDNPLKDFYYPNLLGWTTVQVPPNADNVHPPQDPPSELHAPEIILNNIEDLLSVILNS